MLNPRQFGQLSDQLHKEGGFSVDVKTGHQPTSGIFVSDPEGEESRHLEGTTGAHIQSYAGRHQQALTGPNKFLGGWADEGRAYLDRSTRYPETDLGQAQGYVNMVANRQRAMFQRSDWKETANPAFEEDPGKWKRRITGQNVA